MSAPRKRPAFEPGAGLLDEPVAPASMPRPAATAAGAVLVLLRAGAGLVWLGAAVTLWQHGVAPDIVLDGVSDEDTRAVGIGVLVAIVAGFSLVEAVLAVAAFRGRNGARVALLVLSAGSVVTTFVGWWEEGQQITIANTTLLTLSLDILILLALSSRASAAWARRPRRPRRAPADGSAPPA